ncbi:MAG TPA: leucine--tRNA ligase [Ignavibacteria bacterium]|nr:leucine--tRNA ligase [Ignavibacteria bacterium]HMR40578.1 leucine--tRNA ligase [Ignavibacteria bacterium]
MKYNFTEIEKKWQKYWDDDKTFRTPGMDELDSSKPKYYVLDMLPYPSGDGLHAGHPEGYTATDIIARFKLMNGFNVMHPMGWDAFGLPAEQYAMKTGIHPKIRSEECIAKFKMQLKAFGFSYDWDREINTTDENFFKWTQWIFLKIFNSFYDENDNKAKPISGLEIPEGLSEKEKFDFINSHRLAYLADVPVNWCPELGTVLSNEEVPEQLEKGFTVIRKNMRQWNLRITKYADRLLSDLDNLNWPDNIKELQRNWIGKSIGSSVKFKIKSEDTENERFIEVFTTRPDTIFGVSYLILSPEHSYVKDITTEEQSSKVEEYILKSERKSDLERTELSKEKTGEFTGAFAVNPVNGKEIPILIADYVLASYGTGAIMGVPGHDERDNEFAEKLNLEIIPVVIPGDIKEDEISIFKDKTIRGEECFSGKGISVNSDFLNGLKSEDAISKMNDWLEEKGVGKKTINFKLRDWLFSRQRFWGEPFPIIHFEDGTYKALDESELPVTLPDVVSYKSSGTGESPLAMIDEWVNTVDKETGRKAKRETNTMPQWAGSCWYFLRYLDPSNENALCDINKEKFWMPVNLYIGGAEHAVLHLIYARFWYKILYDLGYVNYEEPFNTLFNQGMILGEDGVKMSKSRGNVINPDDVIRDFGADSMRLFEMFMGPLEATKPWSTKGIEGLNRFLKRVWRLIVDEDTGKLNAKIAEEKPDENLNKLLNKTIKKVTEDIDDGDMKFNTAISYLMIFVNELYKLENYSKSAVEKFILLLSPFAPHISEELWEILGNKNSIVKEPWPVYDKELVKEETATIIFSVNGKVRSKKDFAIDTDVKVLEDEALDNENVKKYILGKNIVKIITVKNKMVNVVVR